MDKNRIKRSFRMLLFSAIFLAAAAALFSEEGYASPVINNISVGKAVLRLGETNTISLNCTDNSSGVLNISNKSIANITNITGAFADIITRNATFLNNTFTQYADGNYSLVISTDPGSKFAAIGLFNITAYCTNSAGETTNSTASFFVINQSLIEGKPINLSVDPFADGRIGFFDYPAEITQYSRMNITVEFINTGSIPYAKTTTLLIYASNFTAIANRTSGTAFLMPGGRIVENLRYTPMIPGYFWIRILINYENKSANAWGVFHVKPYYEGWYTTTPPASAPPAQAGGGGVSADRTWTIQLPAPPAEEVLPAQKVLDYGIKNVSISYPDTIFVTVGESSVAYVIVNNIGTMALRDLAVLGSINANVNIDIQPKTVQVLYGNHSAVFMITLDVPADTSPGTYSLDFTASTDKIKKYGHMDVQIGNASIDNSLERSISNYQYILAKLEDETDTLNLEGKDTHKIIQYIGEAKNALNLAKDSYRAKNYEITRDNLKKTRGSLINAATEIAIATATGAITVMAPTIWLLIALIMIIIIATVALYVHKRDVLQAKKKENEDEPVAG